MAIVLFLLISSGWNQKEDQAIISHNLIEDEEPLLITDPVVQEFDNNTLTFRLFADNAQVFEGKQITKLYTIHIHIFNAENTLIKTRIKAPLGEMRGQPGIMRLWDGVRMTTSDGHILQTEEMFLNQKKNVIYNHSVVTVTSKNDEIVSSAMHYDMTTGVLTLNKPDARFEL